MYRDLDLRIIQELQRDGRASLRDLAQRLGVSTTTISKHLQRLRDEGVIRGFKPVLDYAKLGYEITTITQIKAKGKEIPRIVEALEVDDHLTHVYEITGEFDILVIGKFKDQESMNREIKRLLSHPEIEETNTSVVLSIVKEGADVRLKGWG
jgi:DNA-binding Lrp family transcriptional regulator